MPEPIPMIGSTWDMPAYSPLSSLALVLDFMLFHNRHGARDYSPMSLQECLNFSMDATQCLQMQIIAWQYEMY